MREESGSSTLSMVTIAVVLVALLTPIGIDLGLVARARSQAFAAAEAGALAAVAATGGEVPRVLASRVVVANRAEMLTCDCPGGTATVEVRVVLAPLVLDRLGITHVRATAHAALVDSDGSA